MVLLFGVEVDDKQLRRAIKRVPGELAAGQRRALRDSGFAWRRVMTRRLSGNPLRRRTGHLVESMQIRITGEKLDDLRLHLFSAGVPYARIHELGGTITAKPPRRFLAIPGRDNRTPTGVAQEPSAKRFIAANKGVRIFPTKASGGRTLVVVHGGRLMFVLVPSVRIEPRLGFFRAFDDLEGARRDLHLKALETALRKGVA
jgi:phage gpG-like protein